MRPVTKVPTKLAYVILPTIAAHAQLPTVALPGTSVATFPSRSKKTLYPEEAHASAQLAVGADVPRSGTMTAEVSSAAALHE